MIQNFVVTTVWRRKNSPIYIGHVEIYNYTQVEGGIQVMFHAESNERRVRCRNAFNKHICWNMIDGSTLRLITNLTFIDSKSRPKLADTHWTLAALQKSYGLNSILLVCSISYLYIGLPYRRKLLRQRF